MLFFDLVTEFYRDFGVGMFGLNKAFRIATSEEGKIVFHAITNMDRVMLDDLVGYEIQKKKLVDNTRAFVEGRKPTTACCSEIREPENPPASRPLSTTFTPRGCG